MNKFKLLTLSLIFAGGLSAQTSCQGLTKDSVSCKNTTKQGNLCYLHNPNYVKTETTKAVVCDGTTQKGNSCKNKTKDSSGFCHLHRD